MNANERIAPPDFPVFLGRDWFGDWRARRIRTMLDATPRHSVASFASIQADATSSFAQQVLPALLAVTPVGEAETRLHNLLRDWDDTMTIDAPQPLIFNAWVARFYGAVLKRAGIPPEHGGPRSDVVAFA